MLKSDLYAGALFINLSLQFDLYLSIGILLILAAFFTIGGNLIMSHSFKSVLE
jgi:hypothetical protein